MPVPLILILACCPVVIGLGVSPVIFACVLESPVGPGAHQLSPRLELANSRDDRQPELVSGGLTLDVHLEETAPIRTIRLDLSIRACETSWNQGGQQ